MLCEGRAPSRPSAPNRRGCLLKRQTPRPQQALIQESERRGSACRHSTLRNTVQGAHTAPPQPDKTQKGRQAGEGAGGRGSPGPAGGLSGPADPNSVHAGACIPRRPGHESGRDAPKASGPPPTRRPAPPHRQAEWRLPTDLRPPGPRRSRPTPRGRTRK